MTAQDWVDLALSGKHSIWNIGQLDKPTVRKLDALARQGQLIKTRARFCNISSLKSVWHSPSYEFQAELDKTRREMAQAIGWDAGNRSMRAAGRSAWDHKDVIVAAHETNRLLQPLAPRQE